VRVLTSLRKTTCAVFLDVKIRAERNAGGPQKAADGRTAGAGEKVPGTAATNAVEWKKLEPSELASRRLFLVVVRRP
jgi:hypothetical protein